MTTDDKIAEPMTAVSFPYDRTTVESFRKAFPRARWSDDRQAWLVPGKTAARRFDRWLAIERSGADLHADQKGRDAYAFDPIASRYLLVKPAHLEVRTPYSRTVVSEMRDVPFAAWNPADRLWTVPWRSYETLRRRWPTIEAAARRNEPDERKRRAAERRGSPEELASRARAAERSRHRHPLDPDGLPPLGRPVMTARYGVVVFESCDGEAVDPDLLAAFYPAVPAGEHYVWGRWRRGTLDELIRTWPARSEGDGSSAVWWQPSIDDLRVARKNAARLERRRTLPKGA